MGLKKKKNEVKAGFSLLEVLVSVSIVAFAFTGFYAVSSFGTRYIIESKNRLAATAFVNEKMEIIRNLSYDKVGTQGSIDIPGNLLQEESVVANGKTYQVSIDVRYFDDPMDGTVASDPADLIPNDYKLVEVTVSWVDSAGQVKSVSSSSRFVPPGLETSAGGSPLSINVIDGETLLPISQAAVNIRNSSVSPQINDTINTDVNGHILLPSARISIGDKLTITKNGYKTIETMDSSPIFIPIYGHINVLEGFHNSYDYIQNRISNLTIKTVDYQENPIGDISFTIKGGRVIGHDQEGKDVLDMSLTTGITDSTSGEKKYSNISSGEYVILMDENVQYQLIDYNPSESPLLLPPGSDFTYKFILADKEINTLFLEVKNNETESEPIAGAKVTLSFEGTDIFTEKETSSRGVVFYPEDSGSLNQGEYDLKVEAEGYVTYNGTVQIDELTHKIVQLSTE